MSLLATAMIIISQSDHDILDQKNSGEGEVIVVASMWVPIGMVVLNSVVHTSVTTTSRYWTIKGGIPSSEL